MLYALKAILHLLRELQKVYLLCRCRTMGLQTLVNLKQVSCRILELLWQPLGTDTVVCTGESQYPAEPSDSPGRLDSYTAVTAYVRSRLLDTFSAPAASMAMRPSLQEAYTNLLNLLSSTAETPGSNHSFLLLGARGTGKSLVRTVS